MPAPKRKEPAFTPPRLMFFIHMIAPTAVMKAKIEPTSGHGLGLTRW